MNTTSSSICNTCNTSYNTLRAFREHAKSQWHGINAKRRLQYLEPLTEEEYLISPKNYLVYDSQSGGWECVLCQVTLSNEKTLARHLASKDHKNQLALSDSSSDEDDPEVDPLRECLFCNHLTHDDDLPQESMSEHELISPNLSHMALNHGFRLPWGEHLPASNVHQLMFHLATLVNDAKGCIWCWSSPEGRRRSFASSKAAKVHMRASNHCKIFVAPEQWFYDIQDTSEVELGDLEIYWDFSNQLGESTDESEDNNDSLAISDSTEDISISPSALLRSAEDGLLHLGGKKIRARKTLGQGRHSKQPNKRQPIQRITGKEPAQRIESNDKSSQANKENITETSDQPISDPIDQLPSEMEGTEPSALRSPARITRKRLREILRHEKKHGAASPADRDLLLSGRMDLLSLKAGGRSSAHLDKSRQLAISKEQISSVQKSVLAAQQKTTSHALKYELALSYRGNTGGRIVKKGNSKQGKPEWGWKV